MRGQITVAALAEKLGITRSNLHKRIRREGIKTTKVPCSTGGGVQWLTAVPLNYADQVARQYEEARANAGMIAGKARGENHR
jgi:hypothetical protein